MHNYFRQNGKTKNNKDTDMLRKLGILIFILTMSLNSSAQCAMCRAVVEQGGEEVAEGINSGIVYLMIFPYLTVAIGIYFLYRNWKKTN